MCGEFSEISSKFGKSESKSAPNDAASSTFSSLNAISGEGGSGGSDKFDDVCELEENDGAGRDEDEDDGKCAK